MVYIFGKSLEIHIGKIIRYISSISVCSCCCTDCIILMLFACEHNLKLTSCEHNLELISCEHNLNCYVFLN
jgi:hypothetical protein